MENFFITAAVVLLNIGAGSISFASEHRDDVRNNEIEKMTTLKKNESLKSISEQGIQRVIGQKFVQTSLSDQSMKNQGLCSLEFKVSGSYIFIRSSLFGTELNTKNLVVVRAFQDGDKTYQWIGGFWLGHIVLEFDSQTHKPTRMIVYPGFLKGRINPSNAGTIVCTNFR